LITISLVLVAGCAVLIYLNNNHAHISKSVFELSSFIAQKTRDLRYLTYDYLLYPTKRAEKQWFSVYEEIKDNLKRYVHLSEKERKYHCMIATNIESLSGFFIKIVAISGIENESNLVSKNKLELKHRLVSQLALKTQEITSLTFKLLEDSNNTILLVQARTSLLNVLVLFIFFVTTLITSYITVKNVLVPVNKLHMGTEIVGKGNLDYKTDIRSNDELGSLSRAFDQMAEDLRNTTVSRDYIDNILKSIINALFVADHDMKIKTVNRAMTELLGYTEDELIGKDINLILPKEEIIPFSGSRFQKLLKENLVRHDDMFYLAKSGEKIPVSFFGSAISDKEGKIVGMVGVANDIRQLKDLQEKLVRSEKLAVVGKLGGSMAHELRNPLGAIKNSVYFLRMRLSQSLKDKKINEYLDVLDREINISNKIITDVLTFSRVAEPKSTKIDINNVLGEALPMVEIPENIKVVKNINKDLPHILADGEQLRHVFSNIILNAVQSMPKGGTLTITGASKDDFLEIGFSDTGEGIPKENLKRIFEPLFSTKIRGTGLGLLICQNFIELHKGSINVESEVGKGTKFIVKLPMNLYT
jgi:PAS domain S-box-containing protein